MSTTPPALDRDETLDFAGRLIDWGIPVIVCAPKPDSDQMVPIISWTNITNAAQCREHLGRYRHGTDALALIGGHGIDIIDVDTKADGTIAPFGDLKHYGITRTPSGGYHYVITSTGLRKKQDLTVNGQLVGDYVGGTSGHGSRMIAYLPGSHRPNKYGDTQYAFEQPWDIEGAVLAQPDEKIKEILLGAGVNDTDEPEGFLDDSPMRDPIDGVDPEAQRWVDEEIQRLRDLPQPWAPGSYWDDTTYQVACALLRIANSNWSGYSREDALHDLLENAPSDERWGERDHLAKWNSAKESVGSTGRVNPRDPKNDFDDLGPAPITLSVDVTNHDDAYKWLVAHVGREGSALAGMFIRGEGGEDLVYTPRIGDEGYVEPEAGHDGPAQVRRMGATSLVAYLANHVRVFKFAGSGTARQQVPALYPQTPALLATDSPEHLRYARRLKGVTHTPLVRADGSILATPGYDPGTQYLYMPSAGLRIPRDHRGLALIDELLEGFPFKNHHHRANFIGAMLTPLLRQLVPPPYPLIAINAHQPGSGKSLLARILRDLHGGVLRGEMPREAAELSKQIMAILDSTAAPIVTFDNMSGTLRSAVLESLLTARSWTDRVLGIGQMRTHPNDRLWTLTGNNLQLGGDMARRTVWITIDPGMANPEERTDFKNPNLPEWVADNRGELLAVLLGMVSDWVNAGSPMVAVKRTDDYGKWEQTVASVLAHAGVPGVFNHEESKEKVGLSDEDEWAVFLTSLERQFGIVGTWTVREVLERVGFDDGFEEEELPDDVVEKLRRNAAANKTLGWWLKNRTGRWAQSPTEDDPLRELSIENAGKSRTGVALWRVVTRDSALL